MASETSIFTTVVASYYPKILPPLTTVFTPPPDCSTRWISQYIDDATDVARVGSPLLGSTIADDYYLGCQPYSNAYYYSPGICPSGNHFVEVTELKNSNGTSTVWMGVCCQSGMTVSAGTCSSTFTTPFTAIVPFTLTTFSVGSGSSVLSTLTLYDVTSIYLAGSDSAGNAKTATTTYKNITILTYGTLFGSPFFVTWESKDLASFPPSYATSLASLIGVSIENSAPGVSSTPLPSPTFSSTIPASTKLPPSNARFNSGVKAGIGIGASFGAVLLGVSIVLYMLRRRKSRSTRIPALPEMAINDKSGLKRFLGGKWRAEVDGVSNPTEIDSRIVNVIPGPPIELDAAPGR